MLELWCKMISVKCELDMRLANNEVFSLPLPSASRLGRALAQREVRMRGEDLSKRFQLVSEGLVLLDRRHRRGGV